MRFDRFLGHAFDAFVGLAPWLLVGLGIATMLWATLGLARSPPPQSPLAPEVDPVRFTAVAGFLGWQFGLAVAVFSVALALMARLALRSDSRGWLTRPPPPWVILREALPGLVLGLAAAAATSAFLPPELLTTNGAVGPTVGAISALALAVALPLGSVGAIPLAGALTAVGLPAGMALAFLLAGPATTAGSIVTLGPQLGGVRLAGYLGLTLAACAGAGVAFEAVFPDALPSCCAPGAGDVHADASGKQVAAAGVFGLLAMASTFIRARRGAPPVSQVV